MKTFPLCLIALWGFLSVFAQAPTPEPPPLPGCVLKHIIYDERPTDVWLAYATRDGKEVRLLGKEKDMIKAAKDCREYLKGLEKGKR